MILSNKDESFLNYNGDFRYSLHTEDIKFVFLAGEATTGNCDDSLKSPDPEFSNPTHHIEGNFFRLRIIWLLLYTIVY